MWSKYKGEMESQFRKEDQFSFEYIWEERGILSWPTY